MVGKDFLASLTSGFAALISDGLKALFGTGMNRIAFGSITWADLAVTACLVLLVLLVNGLAAAFLRHKIKAAVKADPNGFEHHFFGALGKPLYLLIWICGIYIAATPLLLKLPANEELQSFANYSTSCSTSACSPSCSGCFSGSPTSWKRGWRIGRPKPKANWTICSCRCSGRACASSCRWWA